MMIEWMITGEKPAGKTKVIKIALKDGATVRVAELTLDAEADAQQTVTEQAETLFAEGTPDDLRAWFAIKQRLSNELLNQVIYAVFSTMQGGGTLRQMLNAGEAVLLTDPLQTQLFGGLMQAMAQASDADRLEFIGLALTVAYGKLGQR